MTITIEKLKYLIKDNLKDNNHKDTILEQLDFLFKEKKYTDEDLLNALYSMWYKAKDGDFDIKEAVKASIDYVQPKTSWEVEWEICETYKLDECNSRFPCCNKPKKLKLK